MITRYHRDIKHQYHAFNYLTRLLQIITVRFLMDNIKQWLRAEPTRRRRAHRAVGAIGLLGPNLDRLLASRGRGRFGHELGVTGLLERDEPEDGLMSSTLVSYGANGGEDSQLTASIVCPTVNNP